VLGAAEDGSPSVSGGKITITPVACPQLEDVLVVRRHLPAAEPAPLLPLGHVRDEHVKDAAKDVADDVT